MRANPVSLEYGISLFRALAFIGLLFLFNFLAGLDSSLLLLSLAAIGGVIVGKITAFSEISSWRLLAYLAGLALALWGVSALLNTLSTQELLPLFFGYSLTHHGTAFFAICMCALLGTHFYWRLPFLVYGEVILLIVFVIAILAGHRSFHFERPSFINDLAWFFRVGNLEAVLLIGTSAFFVLMLYLFLSTLPQLRRPKLSIWTTTTSSSQGSFFNFLLAVVCMAVVAGVVALFTFRHYYAEVLSRTMSGVGEESEEGLSPLTFHSALGSTNQPAALVRLENDFPTNPHSPMLYLRESALSDFNGLEFVNGPPNLDHDITRTGPRDHFQRVEDKELSFRSPLEQSVYLLTNHGTVFSIDYPIKVTPLTNPNPGRFRSAYRALSLAPTYSLEDLISDGADVGDPRWTASEWNHYLRQHPDERYTELAHEVGGEEGPLLQRAQRITEYLSLNTIYTLTPNHNVPRGNDQTAPYLFGDMRGYCVHFAHAMAYLFRSLGIPARIATGYMTDLSQARDGHILLRMSDRHAWAEIYVTGIGWVPFDIQPAQVESHAETPVDMDLLEELMAMIGPEEEILPRFEEGEEASLTPPEHWSAPTLSIAYRFLGLALIVILSLELFIRFGYLLPARTETKVLRAYRSLLHRLRARGLERHFAETHEEFLARACHTLRLERFRLQHLVEYVRFGSRPAVHARKLQQACQSDFSQLRRSSDMQDKLYAFLRLPGALVKSTLAGRGLS